MPNIAVSVLLFFIPLRILHSYGASQLQVNDCKFLLSSAYHTYCDTIFDIRLYG